MDCKNCGAPQQDYLSNICRWCGTRYVEQLQEIVDNGDGTYTFTVLECGETVEFTANGNLLDSYRDIISLLGSAT